MDKSTYCTCMKNFITLNPFLFIRGLPCPSSVQASLTQIGLTIPGFPYNCLPVSCGDFGLLKIFQGLVLAWICGLKVPLLPSGPSCPLQTILQSDLVGCDSPLPILMPFGALFPNLKLAKRPLLYAAGCYA
jgi:hypothetical protein